MLVREFGGPALRERAPPSRDPRSPTGGSWRNGEENDEERRESWPFSARGDEEASGDVQSGKTDGDGEERRRTERDGRSVVESPFSGLIRPIDEPSKTKWSRWRKKRTEPRRGSRNSRRVFYY